MTTPPRQPFFDVRNRGFRDFTEVAAVLALLDARIVPLSPQDVPLLQASGRVLAEAVVSPVNVPGFTRAAMDGFAVRSEDTLPARAPQPVALTVIGEAKPARAFAGTVGTGQAVRVLTGAPMPAGADAVLVVEAAQVEADHSVSFREPVRAGRHVGQIGEDVALGRTVLPPGRWLRPQDVGLLASIGVGVVSVVRRPQVAVLVTGNELLRPGSVPDDSRVVDSNSPMLNALVTRDGGECLPVRYLPDEYDTVRDGIREAANGADVVLVSGGSSVGSEDHAPRAVAELGELPVHGVAMRPAAPTGVGFTRGGVPVFLLPGNPVACLCAYDLLAGRAVRRLGGREWELPYRRATFPVAARINSAVGRVEYARVRVENGHVVPLVATGASMLSTTVTADGFVLVPPDRDGVTPGESVDVWFYGPNAG